MLVKSNEFQAILGSIQHALVFATDAEIRVAFNNKYRRYETLSDSEDDIKADIRTVIDQWAEYCDKLFNTTIYEYNPIWNMDAETVTTTDMQHGLKTTTTQTTDSSASTTYGRIDTATSSSDAKTAAYNTTSSQLTGETDITGSNTASGTDTSTSRAGTVEAANSGIDHNVVTEVIKGNRGVTSTQSLIDQERKLIVDVIDFYISKFGEVLNLSCESLGIERGDLW